MPEYASPVGYRLQPQVFQPLHPSSYFNRQLPVQAPIPVDKAAKAQVFGALMKSLGELPGQLTKEWEAGKKRGTGEAVRDKFNEALSSGSNQLYDFKVSSDGGVTYDPEDPELRRLQKEAYAARAQKASTSAKQTLHAKELSGFGEVPGSPLSPPVEPELPVGEIPAVPSAQPAASSQPSLQADPFADLPPDPGDPNAEPVIPALPTGGQGGGLLPGLENFTTPSTEIDPADAAEDADEETAYVDPVRRNEIAMAATNAVGQLSGLDLSSMSAATGPVGSPAPINPQSEVEAAWAKAQAAEDAGDMTLAGQLATQAQALEAAAEARSNPQTPVELVEQSLRYGYEARGEPLPSPAELRQMATGMVPKKLVDAPLDIDTYSQLGTALPGIRTSPYSAAEAKRMREEYQKAQTELKDAPDASKRPLGQLVEPEIRKAIPVPGRTVNHISGEIYLRSPNGQVKTYDPVTGIITLDIPDGRRYELLPGANTWRQGEKKEEDSELEAIADAIISGQQPPDLKGFYKRAVPLRSILAKKGYDLSRAQLDWQATTRAISSANSRPAQQLRSQIETTYHSLEIIEDLGKQWAGGRFPLLNTAALKAAQSGLMGGKAQSLAQRLEGQINDLVSELAGVYKGGNSPTDKSLQIAAENLKAEFSEKTLMDSINLVRENLRIRLNSLNSLPAVSVGIGNPYDPRSSAPTQSGEASGHSAPAPAASAAPAAAISGARVKMKKPDGTVIFVPSENVERAQQMGATAVE